MAPALALRRLLSAGERAQGPLALGLPGRCLRTWGREGGREDARTTNSLSAGVRPRPLRPHVLQATATGLARPSGRTLGSTTAPAVGEPEGSSSNAGRSLGRPRGLGCSGRAWGPESEPVEGAQPRAGREEAASPASSAHTRTPLRPGPWPGPPSRGRRREQCSFSVNALAPGGVSLPSSVQSRPRLLMGGTRRTSETSWAPPAFE